MIIYSTIYKLIIIISIISLFISTVSSNSISYNSGLTGYIGLLIALMMMLVMIIKNLITNQFSFFQILLNSVPFILLFGIICFILYIITFYKNIITTGHLSNSYYTYSIITIVLMIIQMAYILYIDTTNDKFKNKGILPTLTYSLLFLFITFTVIACVNIYIPLKYFTTDG